MNYKETIIDLRREYHNCAEIGWLEFETTIKIIEYLNKIGIKVFYGSTIHNNRMGLPNKKQLLKHREKIINKNPNMDKEDYEEIFQGYTGAIGVLDTGKQGDTTVLRFDIDALPIKESEENDHIPYREKFISKNENMMHACGHDAHIAIGLMVATKLMEIKDLLSGKIIFIFQPAEEGVRGADSIVHSSIGKEIFKNVDYFISSHIGFQAKQGEVVCCTKGFLGTTKFDISFHGISAHAGISPEKGKNALLAACTCTLNLHTLTQFSKGLSRINVGKIESGSARNVIPNFAKLEVETRSDKEDINNKLAEKLEKCVEGAALIYDVKYEINRVGIASTYEKPNLDFGKKIYKQLQKIKIKTTLIGEFGASEDVTCMMKKTEKVGGKAIYMLIGTERKYPHHNEKFDINEESLMDGLKVYTEIISEITNKF